MAPPSSLYRALDNVKDLANDALAAITSCLYKPSPKLKINGRTCMCNRTGERRRMMLMDVCSVKVVKLLGEGGFSFVYLVEDEDSAVRIVAFTK